MHEPQTNIAPDADATSADPAVRAQLAREAGQLGWAALHAQLAAIDPQAADGVLGQRAWHAGQAIWAGETDINSCSIGIEIINRGHDWGYPDFPARQIAAVTALCRGIILRHRLPLQRVLGHSDVAPARKKDPGEKFPWHSLANSGVGIWVPPAPIMRGEALKLGAAGDAVKALQDGLLRYGYGVSTQGEFDTSTMEAVTAFQRHFRPERVDGVADPSTLMTLQALLASLAGDHSR